MCVLPSSSSWTAQGSYVESNRDECSVSLVYAVHLKKQGSVSFEYQYVDNNIFFEFFVSNHFSTVLLIFNSYDHCGHILQHIFVVYT